MVEEMNWLTPEGLEINIIEEVRKYTRMGVPVSIGTDSMIKVDKITFASAIVFHSFEKNVGNYFVSKKKYNKNDFNSLFSRLGKEIMISIEIAKYIKKEVPNEFPIPDFIKPNPIKSRKKNSFIDFFKNKNISRLDFDNEILDRGINKLNNQY